MTSASTCTRIQIITLFLAVCGINITTSYACEDSAFDFQVNLDDGSTIRKTCRQASKNPWGQCYKPEVKEHCPKLCGLCEGDVQCKIKADLLFHQKEGEFVGFHKQSVKVEKIGENNVCFAGNKKALYWGCTHVEGDGNGDAFIDARSSTPFQKKSANIRIWDGRDSTFRIGVSHVFSEEEVGSEQPSFLGRANLILRINGEKQSIGDKSAFKHKRNPNNPTHIDYPDLPKKENVGFINPQFNGNFFMTMQCDNNCQCTISKEEQECEVKLQLKLPNLSEIGSEQGQRSEDVTVINSKNEEECSRSNNNTSWCRSYSEALVFNYDFFEPLSRAQSVIIPDASDGQFNLRFNITNRVKDKPLLDDPKYAAKLRVYVNGDQKESIDPIYTEGGIGLDCNSNCNCEFD